jgi:DNA-directed RNA polymerase specialized sigma24 family protein
MTCSHPKLRTFTFSSGKTIQSCPDCDTFDLARWNVLGTNPPKYQGEAEYVISGAPFLHISQIEPAALPMKRSIMRPDGTYGWTKKPVAAPDRVKESYDNNPRIVAAFKSHSWRLQNLIRKKIRPHVVSDTLALVTAQELEGDVWMKATAKIGTFREESAFTTWLTTIAKHVADDWIDAHKTCKRDGEVLYDFTEGENEDGDPEGGYPDAKQDGVYTSTGKFNPTEPTVDSLHAAYLLSQRKLIYRKPSVPKYEEPKKWWAPESRELYLELCQLLRQRADKRRFPIPSKAVGQGTA